MKLYPTLSSDATELPPSSDQNFRLARISELDAFLAKEVEDRRKMQKKYQRAVNITQGVSVGVGVVGLGLETAGIPLIATGVGAFPGIVLAALGAGAGLVDLACAAISRKFAAKAAKHAAVMQIARAKQNTIHQLVSKAMTDSNISDEEFKLITDEVEKYQAMKEEVRLLRSNSSKTRASDESQKNEWIELGREEIRAQFEKHMATFGVPQK
jgi:hypothetical protein